METLAAAVWESLHAIEPEARLVSHGGSNRTFPVWLPGALLRVTGLALRRKVSVVLAGDALMYVVLRPLLKVLRVPGLTMVHGLDMTFAHPVYQRLVRPALLAAPRVLANSAATADVARAAGVPADRVTVVRPGLAVPDLHLDRGQAAKELRERWELPADSVLLLTLGRLVERKGVRWLVQHVLPELPQHVVYLVAGTGPELEPVRAAAAAAGVADRVRLLGRVSDPDRELLLRGADLFVQPNIRVAGDMEGFGLVVIEAALRGTPVVGAALEGILDAVENGRTGILVEPESVPAWIDRLRELVADRDGLVETGEQFRRRAEELYGSAQLLARLAAELRLTASAGS